MCLGSGNLQSLKLSTADIMRFTNKTCDVDTRRWFDVGR